MEGLIIIGDSTAGLLAADAWERSGGRVTGFYRQRSLPDNVPWTCFGPPEAAKPGEGPVFLAIEDREAKMQFKKRLEGCCFPPVIHPQAVCSPLAAVAEGALIGAGVMLGPGVSVGGFSLLEGSTWIGAGTRIGESCCLKAGVTIGSGVTVKSGTYIGLGAILKDGITVAEDRIIQTGEILVKDMVMKMVYKRGAWIYRENGPEDRR